MNKTPKGAQSSRNVRSAVAGTRVKRKVHSVARMENAEELFPDSNSHRHLLILSREHLHNLTTVTNDESVAKKAVLSPTNTNDI